MEITPTANKEALQHGFPKTRGKYHFELGVKPYGKQFIAIFRL